MEWRLIPMDTRISGFQFDSNEFPRVEHKKQLFQQEVKNNQKRVGKAGDSVRISAHGKALVEKQNVMYKAEVKTSQREKNQAEEYSKRQEACLPMENFNI